jgi:D-alanyl-D-alanine carboxypeptidase
MLVSTPRDLRDFYQALLSGRLLGPESLRQMESTVPAGPGVGYGLGLFSLDTPCGTVWGHDGGIFGYTTYAMSDRSGKRTVVLAVPTNDDDRIGGAMVAAVLRGVCLIEHVPARSQSVTPTRWALPRAG